MFKVKTFSSVSIVDLTYFTPFSSVSILDFQQVYVCWVGLKKVNLGIDIFRSSYPQIKKNSYTRYYRNHCEYQITIL